jgi:hypothetical protein
MTSKNGGPLPSVGKPYQQAIRYTERHGDRALVPVMVMTAGSLKQQVRSRRPMTIIGMLRGFGEYVQSGEDAGDSEIRRAKIRTDMESILPMAGLDIPPDSDALVSAGLPRNALVTDE